MNRVRSREVAMEILYQMEIQNDFDIDKMLAHYEEVLDDMYIRSTLGDRKSVV